MAGYLFLLFLFDISPSRSDASLSRTSPFRVARMDRTSFLVRGIKISFDPNVMPRYCQRTGPTSDSRLKAVAHEGDIRAREVN